MTECEYPIYNTMVTNMNNLFSNLQTLIFNQTQATNSIERRLAQLENLEQNLQLICHAMSDIDAELKIMRKIQNDNYGQSLMCRLDKLDMLYCDREVINANISQIMVVLDYMKEALNHLLIIVYKLINIRIADIPKILYDKMFNSSAQAS
jgi:hypothetical protein